MNVVIQLTTGGRPKLTVTKDEVRIKLLPSYTEEERERYIKRFTEIAEQISPVENTFRGNVFRNKIVMQTENKLNKKVFKVFEDEEF